MSYIDEKIKPQFSSLSSDLQNMIMQKDVQLHTLQDLIGCLQVIADEPSGPTSESVNTGVTSPREEKH